MTMRGFFLAATLVLTSCQASPPATVTSVTTVPTVPTTAVSTTTTAVVPTTSDAQPDSGDIVGFALDTIEVDGESWLVAVADTAELRSRGMMGVTDFGDVDGMLFEWDELVTGQFWMKDTLMPLDIVFFDASGRQVGSASMTPCEADPCPRYGSDGAYRWALETAVGAISNPLELTLVR